MVKTLEIVGTVQNTCQRILRDRMSRFVILEGVLCLVTSVVNASMIVMNKSIVKSVNSAMILTKHFYCNRVAAAKSVPDTLYANHAMMRKRRRRKKKNRPLKSKSETMQGTGVPTLTGIIRDHIVPLITASHAIDAKRCAQFERIARLRFNLSQEDIGFCYACSTEFLLSDGMHKTCEVCPCVNVVTCGQPWCRPKVCADCGDVICREMAGVTCVSAKGCGKLLCRRKCAKFCNGHCAYDHPLRYYCGTHAAEVGLQAYHTQSTNRHLQRCYKCQACGQGYSSYECFECGEDLERDALEFVPFTGCAKSWCVGHYVCKEECPIKKRAKN